MNNICASDSGEPLEFFKHQGFYRVGDKIFAGKIPAMQHATSTRQNLTWEFGKEEFAKIDWRTRLGGDIRSLYRTRAQQLREKYGYLILLWSGGADSTQALLAFLENDIKLDEVVTYWPYSFMRDRFSPSYDQSAKNMISEWDLSIFPQMQVLKSRFPHQKFTVLDENLDSGIDDGIIEDRDDTVRVAGSQPNYFLIKRYRNMDRHCEARTRMHKDVCIISGIRPSPICRIGRYLCVYPSDSGLIWKSYITTDGIARRTEWFYLTPEFPELTREQAHYMLDHFRTNPSDIRVLEHSDFNAHAQELILLDRGHSELQRRLYKKVCYPGYDPNTFQVKKSSNYIEDFCYSAHYRQVPGMDSLQQAWQSHISNQMTTLDKKYLVYDNNGKLRYFQVCYTKPYVIGELPVSE